MIVYLKIKNFALIDELSVEFEKGLNVVTGKQGQENRAYEAINVILGAPISQNWFKDEKSLEVRHYSTWIPFLKAKQNYGYRIFFEAMK